LCVLVCLAAAAWGSDFASLKPEGFVSDFAGVIDPASRTAIERYCAAIQAKAGVQIAVVTIDTLSGEPIEDVANDLFTKWGVGKKATNEGLLVLLATKDRRMRLEVGYGLEPVIPDGYAGSLLRAMAPALKAGQYGEALTEAVQTIGSRIATAKGVQIDSELPRPVQRSRPSSFPGPLILFGAFLLFWLLAGMGGGRGPGGRRSSGMSLLTGMLLGNLMGRGFGGGGGGGGFGGSDSGGGFGGFGGGGSGGGGASGSW
jgi:uncharacterized protein